MPRHVVFFASPLTLADSEPIPDLTVAPGYASDYANRPPATAKLVVEVAVTSEAADRGMAALCAEAGVFGRPEAGEPRERVTFAGDEEIACGALPTGCGPLATLFAGRAARPPGLVRR